MVSACSSAEKGRVKRDGLSIQSAVTCVPRFGDAMKFDTTATETKMDPLVRVPNRRCPGLVLIIALAVFAPPCAGSGFAADTIEGRVLGAGAPIAKSTVTLWSATADAPKQLGQAQTGDDGRFTLSVESPSGPEGTLYIVAKGGEPTTRKGGGHNSDI